MAKRSKVVRPSWALFALLDGGIVAMTVLALNEKVHGAVNEALPTELPSRRVLKSMMVGTAVIHAAEAMMAARGARRRGLPPLGWAFQTFIVGFPSLFALRRSARA
jgi:hypothetical protein